MKQRKGQMKDRPIRVVVGVDKEIALVPLGRGGKHGTASLYHDDYKLLKKLGISGNWTLIAGKYVGVTVKSRNNEYVARLILDAKDQAVKYLDGDATNLRRDNLTLVKREFGNKEARSGIPVPELKLTPNELRAWCLPENPEDRNLYYEDRRNLNRKQRYFERLKAEQLKGNTD
jgi:hypothetical protein